MVGKAPSRPGSVTPPREIDAEQLAARIEALPGLAAAREAAGAAGVEAYAVGGAVRDALLGETRADLDVVVAGEREPLIEALGGESVSHDHFLTAKVRTPEATIDVVRARAESYAHPGALPDVRPAGLAEDLARRDFTINAMAVPLADPGRLIDPHGGLADLRAGALRTLHARSFADDPTRALRAARYAGRLGLEVEPATLAALLETDLQTISRERVESELRRQAEEESPRAGFELLDEWGFVSLAPGAGNLIHELVRLLAAPPWRDMASPAEAILALVAGDEGAARDLARADPRSPSEVVAAALGRSGAELALARALGADWLDRYVSEWRHVRPAISGDDLLAAGVPRGPAVGRGLQAALRAKLDGRASTREQELDVALEAAQASA
jgi:tRNA nucleotidyltransferase (CCA-adding enzyme)